MPKMKTISGAKKRFKISATGKIRRKKAFHSHLLTKKGTTQKKNLIKTGEVCKADEKNIKKLLVIGG